MPPAFPRLLSREQRAFLGRERRDWEEHLRRARAFLGEGLEGADPSRPVLILGAGSGLEVPWERAPRLATGWDGDPWSRLRTALRHGRWPSWVFADLTGGLADLEALLRRSRGLPWAGRLRDPEAAAARLAGLLPSLRPEPAALRAWIRRHRPGAVLGANVMGQFGAVARRLVEEAFAPGDPWEVDPEQVDPLAEALDRWTARCVEGFLGALEESGAELWLVHDRGVIHSEGFELGPPGEPWTSQLGGRGEVELSDPLGGVDVVARLRPQRVERWLWPLGPGQLHLMEAVLKRP